VAVVAAYSVVQALFVADLVGADLSSLVDDEPRGDSRGVASRFDSRFDSRGVAKCNEAEYRCGRSAYRLR